ncbi:response regulator with CheY-like receiver domain and winged-helix DNA-binding domain [Desulfitobacterium dehalogenans ATCC 51507]|uniref:Stage 0 sporulation protein A homolog n=1 Tax=Desulfitobacterium dehalogenans (strain ATCC 51507 / DSM 9161 / JW/IU-DC1) TaxID=756499 RepID=I4A818_DESDJ|nr:response regulator [Desulfitobacterium dehalogenans]AFM00103.1 response regulator with CheY-like receiver domain and winged-helix DNA-binding domain [Desulfitobacterium dehalogenans ATCC 51507]
MRILLVEDEKGLSGYIAKGLKNGYAVDAVYDGEEVLFEYEVNEYDLIVLDLNLPKKDGLEVLRRIREKNADIKTPKKQDRKAHFFDPVFPLFWA